MKPAAPLASETPPPSHQDATPAATLALEGTTASPTAPAPPSKDTADRSETLPSPVVARPDSAASTPESNPSATRISEPEPQIAKSKPQDSLAQPGSAGNSAGAGWISIPNSGKLPVDGSDEIAAKFENDDPATGSRSTNARDVRAHTAKDISFEPESSQPRTPSARGERPGPNR